MTTILLLEDEADLREEVADFLVSQGYDVHEAGSVVQFEPLIDAFDIAIIDVGLPDGDGLQVAAKLRAARPQCGIVMLTAQGGLRNKIASLRESADFYLVKPVSFDELSAHLVALERRLGSNWQLRILQRKLISPSGYSGSLSENELILLKLIAAHPGTVVSRKMIAAAFGVDWLQFDERRLDQIVSRLRRRWLRESGKPLPFRTEHGKGFVFLATIDVS
ncbi:response regulator transcription factor [Oxalicibacterium faecigallinarum]|uniref:Transcriptional regulator n=1 Tax=Oxalicibacterium faecigallinarum TaxID=573741 RepID=A0A8J3AP05_9BURK|nr:response regulator transcription factor [Oxalicibacterium faecigallinarum]GGI18028.1 transcriptional regulator [Oxalicibacterium faecigallinarum]